MTANALTNVNELNLTVKYLLSLLFFSYGGIFKLYLFLEPQTDEWALVNKLLVYRFT